MINDDWVDMFSGRVLDRGEDYYFRGKVGPVKKTKDGYKALVYGSDVYETEIHMDGDEISDMECDCPYAEDGNYCKHMAALLLKITEEEMDPADTEDDYEDEDEYDEEEYEYDSSSETPASSESFSDILAAMTEDQLREELSRIAEENPNIRDRIFNRYRKSKATEADVNRVELSLENLAYVCGDRYGFIGWKEGHEYVDSFMGVLNDLVQPMIDKGVYWIAFLSLDRAAHVLENVEMDGSNGEHSDIAFEIEAYWNQAISKAPEDLQERMHQWFVENMPVYEGMMIKENIETLMENSFSNPRYLLPILDDVRNRLNNPDLPDYTASGLLKKYRELLEKTGDTTDEYEHWLQAHEDLPAVMELRLAQAEEAQDWASAERLIKALCLQETVRWKITEWKKKLLEICRKTGNTEQEKETLEDLLINQGEKDSSLLQRLRELSDPENWEVLRETYIRRYPDKGPQIYYEEKQYQKLVDVLKHHPFSVIQNYYPVLKKQCPEKLLKLYVAHLDELIMEHPCNSLYAKMKRCLLDTADIPGAEDTVDLIIAKWKIGYPTRKSMQAMLKEVQYELKVKRQAALQQ
ncbi:MAG: SWIM zinc finger family protein [Solobacterium sp.]|nr:SWIM zinc finger family protein [Solobacterium sp.]